jgi:hypothetical protein
MTYRQCRLERREGATRAERMSWLPVPHAVAGAVLKLRNSGTWSDGWIVTSASGPALDEKAVVAMNRAHLKQRRASDI